MEKNEKENKGGIGFLGALTLIFITLKLCNVIAWSWVWVLSPIWITLAIAVVIVVIAAIVSNL